MMRMGRVCAVVLVLCGPEATAQTHRVARVTEAGAQESQ